MEQKKKLDIESCCAVKGGWFAILATIIFECLVAMVGAMIFSYVLLSILHRPLTNAEVLPPALASFILLMAIILYAFRDDYIDYWKRNVVGYAVQYWLGLDGSIASEIVYGRDNTWQEHASNLYIPWMIVPLGGWFRRARAFACGSLYNLSIKTAGVSSNHVYVYLSDKTGHSGKQGSRLLIEPANALKTIVQLRKNLDCIEQTIMSGIYNTNALVETRHQLRDCAEERENFNVLFDDAVKAGMDAIQEIFDSKRFVNSQEARDIRHRLAERILPLLSHDDVRYQIVNEYLKIDKTPENEVPVPVSEPAPAEA